ncbi:MAG: cation-transporting P-type ATPase [Gammaproteobacteria bacterium]|nr:cation-transporting P-type ATPase [Gammaproteobacteria bacterium]
MDSPEKKSRWHAEPIEETLRAFDANRDGLSEKEARARFERDGPNALPPPTRRSALRRFAEQFHNVLIYVLMVAALVTALLGHWIDTGVIVAVVVVNAVIGFLQEGKAERALDAVRGMLSPQALVLRDGARRTIPAEELVAGDVVVLTPGDRVPADLRLLRSRELRIDESLLTGESVPVAKHPEPVADDAVIGDRTSIAFSGTLVTYGQGLGLVVATGTGTELGRISALLASVQTLTTPLLRALAVFGRRLTGAILAIATATFAYGVLARGYGADEMLLAAVGLSVAAIPEGLPAIITITLAIGVQRMSRRNAIIRRLPAVEALGSVSVVCSDKTGTLTRNEMTVVNVLTAGDEVEVSGVGYDPHGDFELAGRSLQADEHAVLREACKVAILCNDADARLEEGSWRFVGDPTELALLVVAIKGGLDPRHLGEAYPRSDVIPFESEHRLMATLHHDHAGHGFVFVKGAPEAVLGRCSHQLAAGRATPLDTRAWHARAERIAARGRRMLALAIGDAPADRRELRFEDIDEGLTMVALVGIIDPPRDEAMASVRQCHDAGIRVKMITGDHAVTASAIAAQMAIGDGSPALTGAELEQASDVELRRLAEGTDVFARASPEHKLRLVEALQANGEVVSMTGDGVNDAPALKRADIGVAMGVKGTEAAKEAAEMVLADDNFASIASAIEEGRTVYDNIRKSILFILPTNGGQALTLIAAILAGTQLPVTPAQILWVNMITAVTLALALAFEPSEPSVMQRPPREPDEPILSLYMLWRIVLVAVVMVAGTFGLYVWERDSGASVELARTVAVNTLVMFEIFYLLNSRFMHAPVLNRAGLLGNRYVLWAIGLVLVFQMLFTYAPWMQFLFRTASLDGAAWLRIVLVGATVLLIVEAEKWLARRLATDG